MVLGSFRKGEVVNLRHRDMDLDARWAYVLDFGGDELTEHVASLSKLNNLTPSSTRFSNTARCAFPVTVEDETPPTITCPEDIVVECTDGNSVDIEPLPAHASDTCTTADVSQPGAASYPVGEHALTYVAVDQAGNQASCASHVIVTDRAAPDVQVTRSVTLWPPDHAMHEVSLADCGVIVSDGCSGGPAGADIEWIDATRVRLRAERAGRGDGRVYRIHFEARDAAGNATPAVCEVAVPHDQSGTAATDSGAAYSACR